MIGHDGALGLLALAVLFLAASGIPGGASRGYHWAMVFLAALCAALSALVSFGVVS